MRKKSLLLPLIFFFLLAAVSSAPCKDSKGKARKGSAPSMVIDPTVSAPDGFYSVRKSAGRKFLLGEFTSSVGSDSSVGVTRTGRRTLSGIVCEPDPGEALEGTLGAALSAQGLLAEDGDTVAFIVSAHVLEFRLEEVTRFLHQSMNASMKVEVTISGPAGERIRKFKMESGGERKTFDTTKQAEPAAREAVRAAANEILKSLDSL